MRSRSDIQNRPKILVLCPDLPLPIRAGGQMRMASFVQALAGCAKVHVACIAPEIPETTAVWANDLGITIEHFASPRIRNLQLWIQRIVMVLTECNLLHRKNEQRFFDEVFNRFDPNLVWLETPYLVRYAMPWKEDVLILVDHWGTSEGARRIFLNDRGIRRIWSWFRWRAARGGELRYAPKVKDIVCVSRLDAQYFKCMAPKTRVWPIPNGILEKEERSNQSPLPRGQDAEMMLTGDLSYLPNIDAAVYFVKEILPLIRCELPQAIIELVGRNPSPEVLPLGAFPGVRMSGEVPDMSEAIARTALYVLPMRLGSGIRSKLFDVFPLGKAIVSTTIGAEGLELYHNKNCLLADTPADFAKACIKLLKEEI